MSATCVIGLQWGDEAKGKIVDLLTEHHEIVVRYQGGSNAGHTVVTGGQTYKLSLIPSGILRPQVRCVVTGGVVLNPVSLLGEIDGLVGRGVQVAENLMLSDRAHVIFPWHLEEERCCNPRTAGGESIGTTMRGIGPCYRDKVGRTHAIRLGDLYRPSFRDRVAAIVADKNTLLKAIAPPSEFRPLEAAAICAEYEKLGERLRCFVGDTTAFLLDAAEAGRPILFEGAQGALLDIDHGTYPFVTSSNSSGVGIASGSGVPARHLGKIVGIVKAYTTRVGGGPLPTEQDNAVGEQIRQRGNEYGTVTRRPRRCGWFDAVAARYTSRLSGIDCLAVMLLDVLSALDEIKICTSYRIRGQEVDVFPSHVEDLAAAEPVYETLPGWQKEITTARRMSDLPAQARRYLDRIQELIERPVEIVSVGPDREQTIFSGGSWSTAKVR